MYIYIYIVFASGPGNQGSSQVDSYHVDSYQRLKNGT